MIPNAHAERGNDGFLAFPLRQHVNFRVIVAQPDHLAPLALNKNQRGMRVALAIAQLNDPAFLNQFAGNVLCRLKGDLFIAGPAEAAFGLFVLAPTQPGTIRD